MKITSIINITDGRIYVKTDEADIISFNYKPGYKLVEAYQTAKRTPDSEAYEKAFRNLAEALEAVYAAYQKEKDEQTR